MGTVWPTAGVAVSVIRLDANAAPAAPRGRTRRVAAVGWSSLVIAVVTLVLSLLAWPLGWWAQAATSFHWYPMSPWIAWLGIVLCTGCALLFLDFRRIAAVVFISVTIVSLLYFLAFWLIGPPTAFSEVIVINGIPQGQWGEHPAPWILVLIVAAASAGLISSRDRWQSGFSGATSAVFIASLFALIGCAYQVGYPLIPNPGAVISPAPGLFLVGISVAIATSRPRARPTSWLTSREGVVGLVAVVANLIFGPLIYEWLGNLLTSMAVEHATDFAAIAVIVVVVAEITIGIEYLADRTRWSRLMEIAADGVLIVRPDGTVAQANEESARILGVALDDLVETSVEDWMPEADRARHRASRAMLAEAPVRVDTTLGQVAGQRADGTAIPLDVSIRPVRSGEDMFFVVSLRDASLTSRLQSENEEIRTLLAEATETSVIGQVLVSPEGRIIQATAAMASMLGVPSPAAMAGRPAAAFIALDDLVVAREALLPMMMGAATSADCELRLVTSHATTIWGHIVARTLHGSTDTPVISAQVLDITERRAAEELASAVLGDLEFRSSHDVLTGLPNRAVLLSRMAELLASSPGPDNVFTLLYCDIDNFKFVNDEFSHAAGDELLVQIANRLSARLESGDLLARVSGDEFVMLLAGVGSETTAASAGQGLLDAIREDPFELGLGRVHSSLSMGVALSRTGIDPNDLLREADLALYAAKAGGRARLRLFDESMRLRADRRKRVAESLGQAISEDRIHAWLQPIVRMRDRTVVGYEALARWDSSEGQELPTQDWIELADEVGLLAPVGERLLDEVLSTLDQLPPDVWIAVNLAGSQLTPAVVAQLLHRLDVTGVDPTRLVVEVREKSLARSPESAVAGLQDLADSGVRVFFDDFGTGQSSMTRLGELPIAGLKLDRTFTDSLTRQPGPGWRLARALAEMAVSLGLETIAAGIETPEQESALIAAGWDYGQGWLYGMASPDPFGPVTTTEAVALPDRLGSP